MSRQVLVDQAAGSGRGGSVGRAGEVRQEQEVAGRIRGELESVVSLQHIRPRICSVFPYVVARVMC